MNKKLGFAGFVALIALLIGLQANASINNPVGGSSGGSGGGLSTSTQNTFSVNQNFNGITNFGNVTTTLLNGITWVPANFATAGCSPYTSSTDYGACVNAIYASFPSSTWNAIIAPPLVATQAQYLTGINFNRNGVSVNYISFGGTTLKYGGTGSALTVNTQNPTGHLITQIGGFNMQGSSTLIAAGQVNTATTTGITCGGSNGCVGVHFHDMSINGFGKQIHQTSNAYMNTYADIALSGGNGGNVNGSCFIMDPASNSGERTVLDHVTCTDPGNSTATKDIYISDGAAASTFIKMISLDDAQIYNGFSNGLLEIAEIHIENSDKAHYPQYIPIYATSSAFSHIHIGLLEIANDGDTASNTFQTIIKHGQILTIDAWNLNNYGGQTVTNLTDHSLNNGSSAEKICGGSVQGGGLTNIVGGSGAKPYSAAAAISCAMNIANSYTIAMYPNGSNTNNIDSGNTTVGTFDHSGNWMFLGNVSIGGTLNVTSTATFQATSTFLGTAVASGTQYYAAYYSNGTTTAASTTNINWGNGNVQSLALGTSTAITFSNVKAGGRYLLMLVQDATGSRTVTWPSSVQWSSSTAPALTTTAGKMDLVTFVCAGVSSSNCYGGANLNYSP